MGKTKKCEHSRAIFEFRGAFSRKGYYQDAITDDGHFGYGDAPVRATCVSCNAQLPLGPSNDDSPAVRLEMLAAIHLGGPRTLPDVWDARGGMVEFGNSERIPEAWAWDISRPLVEQDEPWMRPNEHDMRAACASAGLFATDPPLTVTIDFAAAQINGLCDAPPLFTPDEAEALADDLLLGADAARQAARDGYHGPAVVVELKLGPEPGASNDPVHCVECGRPADSERIAYEKWWTQGANGWTCVGCNAPGVRRRILTPPEAAECAALSDSDVCQACGDKWTEHGQTCSGSLEHTP